MAVCNRDSVIDVTLHVTKVKLENIVFEGPRAIAFAMLFCDCEVKNEVCLYDDFLGLRVSYGNGTQRS